MVDQLEWLTLFTTKVHLAHQRQDQPYALSARRSALPLYSNCEEVNLEPEQGQLCTLRKRRLGPLRTAPRMGNTFRASPASRPCILGRNREWGAPSCSTGFGKIRFKKLKGRRESPLWPWTVDWKDGHYHIERRVRVLYCSFCSQRIFFSQAE